MAKIFLEFFMENVLKEDIHKAMTEVASRKPGNKRLVYRKSTGTIVIVDRSGQVVEDTGFTIHEH